MKNTFTATGQNALSLAGSALSIAKSFLPEKEEYSGEKGNVARGVDTAYDKIAMGVTAVNPLAGFLMQANSALSTALSGIGLGTDGMCVCAGTKVITANGDIIKIEDLRKSNGIIGWDPETKAIRRQIIASVISRSEKECIEIVLETGQKLKCSIDHPILSLVGYTIDSNKHKIPTLDFKHADQLKVNEYVCIANSIDFWGTKKIDNAYFLGCLLGGKKHFKRGFIFQVKNNNELYQYIRDNNIGTFKEITSNVYYCSLNQEADIITQLGMYRLGRFRCVEDILSSIGKYDKETTIKILSGLYDTRGFVHKDGHIWLYCDLQILNIVQLLLQKLGIISCLEYTRKTKSVNSICLVISGKKNIINFRDKMQIQDSVNIEKLNQVSLSIQKSTSFVTRVLESYNIKHVKIISTKYIGKQVVYNLQANYDHTYIANGIITHNTTADSILGSPFFMPLNIINGAFGKNADTITKDKEAFETVGSSYTGTNATVDEALKYSGKRYGLVSGSARKRANKKIAEAKRQQSIMSDIAENSQNWADLSGYMTDMQGQQYAQQMQGGYNQQDVRVGEEGMEVPDVNPWSEWYNNNDEIKKRYKFVRKGKGLTLVKRKQKKKEQLQEGGAIIDALWVPKEDNNLIDGENTIYSMDPEFEEIDEVQEYKFGGQFNNIIKALQLDFEENIIEALEPIDEIEEYKKGGTVNVIPEGALHARLNHMDVDGITRKGIPVVSVDGEQQAEIERNEIILRLEVTEKIEQASEIYYDENSTQEQKNQVALEIGKLITQEVLYNTEDNTGLIKQTKYEKKIVQAYI